jgi:predicted ATPase with chaperone activity
VARTIADLDDRDEVSESDMAEALAFRAVEPGAGA